MLVWLRKSSTFPLILAAGAGLVSILLAALSGVIKNFFDAEEFYIYHYANNLPHIQAWQQFFHENGRLIEGLYWTYQYELLGYNPLLEHSLSFVLLLILSVLSSACFLNVWPQRKRSTILPYLFVFLLFTNWVSAAAVFRQSYDNTHISMIFFFLAGLAVQRWATTQHRRWLLLSYFFFLVSVLTYENAAFLFPALLILAWPLVPSFKKHSIRNRILTAFGLTAVSGFILLIPAWFTSNAQRGPRLSTEFNHAIKYVFESAPEIYLKFGQFLRHTYLNPLVGVGLLTILVLAILRIVNINHDPKQTMTRETRSQWTCIFLASIWFLVFGPLPYTLLGYEAGGRVYSSAVFGVIALILMLYEMSQKGILRKVSVAIILLFAGFGLLMLREESLLFKRQEFALNIFFRELKAEVPYVRPNTDFIFINRTKLDPYCGSSLEMLYNQKALNCYNFKSSFLQCPPIRRETEIVVDCEHLTGENWILIDVDNDVPNVIDELKPGDFNLPIIWESFEPIRTDHKKIVTNDLPPASEFYLHLQQRAKVLFSQLKQLRRFTVRQ
jgi:hypothetical protein